MPVYASDSPEIARIAASATEQRGNDKKLALERYLKGLGPNGELGAEAQNKIGENKAILENEMAALKDLNGPNSDLTNAGGSVGVGTLKIGGDPYAHMQGMLGSKQSTEAGRLGKTAKDTMGSLNSQLESVHMINQLLDDPNSIDQKKLQVLNARLVEGNGQRLLDSVIQAMGAGKGTLEGSIQDKLNYLSSGSKSGLGPDVKNAMRESSFKYFNELSPQFEDAKNKFKAYAPVLTPDVDPMTRENLVNAEFAAPSRLHNDIKARQTQYMNQKNTVLPRPATVQNYNPPTNVAGRVGNNLSNFITGIMGKGNTSAQAAAPQQSTQQGPTMRVVHKASGQVGTIPSDEFDPSVYQQVGGQ